ncbi:hypothetical protein HY382_01450 [Candidatus Curtissbacteria bacterium]|nr:hypothetical protein [Candidatus Curtissbacteria bacterium]
MGSKIFIKMGIALFVLAMVDLIFVNYWIWGNAKNLNVKIPSEEGTSDESKQIGNIEEVSSPTPYIQASPSPEPSVEPKTIIQKETKTIVQTAQKEIFIPLGSGSASTNSFSDIPGTDVTVDFSKYSEIDYMVFEASVWVLYGNGRAYGQIKNVSDKNPLAESIVSSNSSTGEVKISGRLPVPSGVKTFRMMAKTDITDFPAHLENGRLKIVLK